MSGISDRGFIPESLDAIRARIFDRLSSLWGEIDSEPDAPTAQLVEPYALENKLLWEEFENLSTTGI